MSRKTLITHYGVLRRWHFTGIDARAFRHKKAYLTHRFLPRPISAKAPSSVSWTQSGQKPSSSSRSSCGVHHPSEHPHPFRSCGPASVFPLIGVARRVARRGQHQRIYFCPPQTEKANLRRQLLKRRSSS
eukprot:scaffold171_cov263-Pinguiococcus_pyrenoidosus.AAC.2